MAPWDLRLRQISTGAFEGNMQFTSLGDILVYRDCWSQSGAASCALPTGYMMLATGLEPDSGIDWCGRRVSDQILAFASQNAQSDFIMPSQTPYLAILLPERCLNILLGDDKSHSLLSSAHYYGCHPGHGRRLIARLNWLIEHCLANPGLLEDPDQRNALEISLIDNLAEMGFGLATAQPRIGPGARRKALSRALEYCESVRGKISIPQFAAQLGINRRSLELIFREFLGITPRQYLMYRRLHGVHEELRRQPPGSFCITAVAHSWGFTELGRFAGEYKNLFGELPSETLNRSTNRAPRQFIDLLH